MGTIKENLEKIRQVIAAKAILTGRNTGDITLVAVTKTVPADRINEAIALGVTDLGENKVQEAEQKFPLINGKVTWHLIGHLQTNKVKAALAIFDLIHSVDSLKLAREISKQAQNVGKVQSILLEVNISGEESKFGLKKEEVMDLLRQISVLPNIKVCGLMTMAPFVEDEAAVRSVFKGLKELAGQAR